MAVHCSTVKDIVKQECANRKLNGDAVLQVDGASVNRFSQVEPFYGVLKQTKAYPMDESGCKSFAKWMQVDKHICGAACISLCRVYDLFVSPMSSELDPLMMINLWWQLFCA